jgi:general secretion pathway protein B
MSLILEALKKAERQHKLGEVPRITPATEQSVTMASRRLGWLMISLLALILVGVGVYLGSSWFSVQRQYHEPSVSDTAAVLPDVGQKIEPASVQPLDSGGQSTLTVPVPTTPPPQAAIEPRPVTPSPQMQEVVELLPVAEAEPVPLQAPKPLHEMPSGFVANLPSLNIDIHSYDKQPANRYVLINMEKYREGDYLAEGPRVLEILPQGAVMEHMGERFILPIGN